jgi:hypothetical protein
MEKTIKDIVVKSHNAYLGKFWNRHLKIYQRWNEGKAWQEEFDTFCTRMWLDNCDENKVAYGNPLPKQEYLYKWEDYLVERFQKET